MRKNLLLFFIFLIIGFLGYSQNFSNKGKDFWVGYGYHQVMVNGNTQDMTLYFATDQLTTVTVSIPGLGYTQTYSNIPANTIFTAPALPKAGPSDSRLMLEGLSNKGIHIVSTKPIVAYAHIYNASVSGACVLLPTPTLGKEYYSINYTNNSNSPNSNSWFYVVAADTGTTNLEIVPSANTTNGWIAGNTYTVTLTQGQIYNVMGSLLSSPANCNPVCTAVDLTGSKIKSVASGTGGCKRIGVYSGSGRISLTCNGNQSSSDNYMVQAFPKSAWGKRFLTATTGGNMTRNIYRVCVSDPTTIVKINGIVTTLSLINNFYYEIPVTSTPLKIEGDLPITVAQYVPSQSACGNGNPGDPEVIYLSPVEQSISNVIFNSNLLVSSPNAPNPPHNHLVNVIIPNAGTAISSFKRDGVTVPPASFTIHPQDPAYSYIKIAGLALGQHTLVSDSGFNAIAYGFAQTESYGYNAGTNVRDFNQNLEIQSLYGIINEPSSCSNSPFSFRIYLPDSVLSNSGPTAGTNQPVRFDSMKWEVTNATAFGPNNFPVRIQGNTLFPPIPGLKVAPDSLTIKNGKSVAWYSIPNQYAISTAGTYTITITGYRTNNNADGCNTGNETEYEFDLIVANPPLPTFTYNQPGCPADSVRFLETTPQGPTPTFFPTYRFWWDFGDPASGAVNNTSNLRNPVHKFSGSGNYQVRFANITTPGCLSDTIPQTITVPDLVNATLTGTTTLCQNDPQPNINFTITDGLPPYKINYTLSTNGGAAIPQTPIITSTLLNPFSVSTTTAAVYTYNITSIENANAAFCIRPITGQTATVTVNPKPTATISGTINVCQNTPTQTITFTGTNGSTATTIYRFTYISSINGVAGAAQTINSNTAGIATITVPTTTIGTYTYDLISVSDVGTTCQKTLTAGATTTATVFVQATPAGTVTVDNAVVCQDVATPPAIVFTGSGANGQAPYIFTYTITTNNVVGPVQTISTVSTSNSTVPINVPMATAGTLVYTILSVQNSGVTNCTITYNAATAPILTVTINPIPTASITGTTTVCQNTGTKPITFTGAGGTGASYDFNYTLNGVAQTTLTGNNIIINQPTTAFGVYTYIITSVKDNATGCTKTYSTSEPTAVITVNELATASIATSAATVCQANTTLPIITFTALGGLAPYKFNYTITTNGVTGAVQTTPFTSFGNSYQLTLPTATPGTYIYTLVSVQESSSAVCVNPQTSSTQVIIHPKPTANIVIPGPYCQAKAINFSSTSGISPTGSITQWVWDYDDGTGPHIRTDDNLFTVTYPTIGIKNVTLKTVSDNGCESDIDFEPITINVKPKAGFINPESCLADVFANFTDTSKPAGAIALWEWNFGDIGSPTNIVTGSTPAQQNPQHAYTTTGPKSVMLQVTTAAGCKADTTQAFFINGVVTSTDFIAQNPPQFCSNKPVTIKENSVVAVGALIRVDIYWDFLGAPTVFEQDDLPVFGKIYSHNYPILLTDKIYTIRYRSYTGFDVSCFKTIDKQILVKGSPVALFGTIPPVCLNGGPVQLTQGVPGGTAVGPGTYLGTGVTQTSPGVFMFDPLATNVLPGGSYTISYTATSSASCDSTTTQQITVLRPPIITDFSTVGNRCHNNAIKFHNEYTNVDGIVTKWIYNWNDGTPIQTRLTGADFPHVYTTTGPHFATLTLETGDGCKTLPRRFDFTVNPLPAPRYDFTNSVCLPSATITFTNTTQNVGSNTYQWSFQYPSTLAADTSTLQTGPTHTYTTQGPFSTHLVATNIATGCVDSTVIIVIDSDTIHAEPVLRFDPLPDVCLNNGTISFATYAAETSNMLGGPGIFSCPLTPGAISTSGVFNPLIAGVGPHVIKYTFTSSFNCPAEKIKTVTVLAPPMITEFRTVGNVCATESVTFRNAVTPGAGTTSTWVYNWGDSPIDSTATNGNDVTHTYAQAGTYNVTLYVITDGKLCKSALAPPLQVIVHPLPVPNFTYSDTACLPQASVLFKNTTQNINDWDYRWNFDVPSTLSSDQSTQPDNITHVYTDITTPPHLVKLTATSLTTGCTRFITKPITTIHPAPVANFSFNKTSVCLAQDVTVFDNSTFADGNPLAWSWNFGDNNTNFSGKIQPPHIYAKARTYDVKLTVTNSFGCTDDTTRPFTVYAYPVVYAGPDDYVLEGGSIPLAATAYGNILSYLWTAVPSPTYLSSNIVLNPIASPLVDVFYKLTVTGQGNCVKSDSGVFIKVLKFPEIPNTFTPNNDGIHDFWEIKYLYTYPANRVQVFTRTGQLVFESKGYTKPWNGTINGKSLPFDTYYYIIEPGSGRKPITGYVTIVK